MRTNDRTQHAPFPVYLHRGQWVRLLDGVWRGAIRRIDSRWWSDDPSWVMLAVPIGSNGPATVLRCLVEPL